MRAAIYILLAAYWTVLAAELIGDKSLYTITSLASRYGATKVYAGISLAFIAKISAAVLFGQSLLQLPRQLTTSVSAATFFITAFLLWRERHKDSASIKPEPAAAARNVVAVSFAAIFFSEWADIGQISAAALVVRYGMPVWVEAGAVAALMTKGLLALTVGIQLRQHAPPRVVRIAAVGSCCLLGVMASIVLVRS